jgi:hypothetical protein
MKRMKAAMLDAGITNFSGTTPSEGELPSGAPHPPREVRWAVMTPTPFEEFSRQQTAERVTKAYREVLVKDTRKGRVRGVTRLVFTVVGFVFTVVAMILVVGVLA